MKSFPGEEMSSPDQEKKRKWTRKMEIPTSRAASLQQPHAVSNYRCITPPTIATPSFSYEVTPKGERYVFIADRRRFRWGL